MSSISAGSLRPAVGNWALRELPARAATFLYVVGVYGPIRARLALGGYGDADHDEGLSLLARACARQSGGSFPQDDDPARYAEDELLLWLRRHRPRLRAALQRLHPMFVALLADRAPADAPNALLAVSTLLDRLDELAADRSNRAHAALLQTLAQRGLDDAERERLRQWVQQASTVLTPNPRVQNDAALHELCSWYDDWTTTARTLITRRDWLIRMGVARQRRRGVPSAEVDV